MKKKLLLPIILLPHMLFITACVNKSLVDKEITPITSNEPLEIHTPDINDAIANTSPTTSSSNGTAHHLKSIQNDSITIIENGNVGFKFPQFKNKIIIFQIFGKDCEYCFEEMPIINRIKSQYENKVEVVAIQAQDRMTASESSSLIAQHSINYPIIEGDSAQSLLRFLAETYGWTGVLPYILLIKNGATEYNFSDGGVSQEEFQESIESLL